MKLSEKNKKRTPRIKITKAFEGNLRKAVWFILGFLMSVSTVSGGCSPFAISVISVSAKGEFLFTALGAGLGYIFFSPIDASLRYFSAVIISAVGTFAVNIFKGKKSVALPMATAFLSVLSTGLVMNFKEQSNILGYALTLSEAILACGGAFFFFKTANCNIKRLKFRALPVTDLTCVIITASLILSAVSVFEIKGVSPGRIIAVLIILFVLRFGSQKCGVTAALCLGFALGISKENSLFLLGAYAFSALAASLFSSLSSFGVGMCFTASMTFFAVAADMGAFSVCCVIESFIGCIVLSLLPEKITDKISDAFENGSDITPDGSLRQSLITRLRFASSALSQVSESVRDVREKINTLSVSNPADSELRMVAADQFFSISDMLGDLAFEFDEAENFDFKAAGKIRHMLGEYDIYPENISVITDKYGRTRVEIFASKNTKGLDSVRVKAEISKICRREFASGVINPSGVGKMLSFTEKPNFKISVGFAQYCAEGKLCGDTIKAVNDSRGHTLLIISDGMGKGGRAALDGAMGAGLLSKLLCAGFGFDSSLKVVNSALLVKSGDESLATLDCVSVDMFTGKCEFYKAGAPASYIVKKSEITKCELSSMPAGILRGIEFAKRTTMLCRGDEIIMMSDGVTDIVEKYPESRFVFEENSSPNDKAKAILDFALKNSDERRRDDMSVIAAKLL